MRDRVRQKLQSRIIIFYRLSKCKGLDLPCLERSNLTLLMRVTTLRTKGVYTFNIIKNEIYPG